MDPSDLLPGLGDMLEKHLGRQGYHVTTFVVVMAALMIILLPAIPGAALWPILKDVVDPSYFPRFGYAVFVLFVVAVPAALISYAIMVRVLQPWLFRKLEERNSDSPRAGANFGTTFASTGRLPLGTSSSGHQKRLVRSMKK